MRPVTLDRRCRSMRLWAAPCPAMIGLSPAGKSGCRSTPSAPRVTRPWTISSFMIQRARLIGMLKPTPSLPPPLEAIELLIPMTSPFMLTRGPPNCPG